jgi:flagellar biosynthesis activator protein FlaF
MQAYKTIQKATIVSEREIDAYALTQSANKLRECQQNWNIEEKSGLDRLFAVLKLNSMLWSIFQAEITKEDSPLSRDVRQNLLTLSLFVDKRTKDIMCFPEPEKLNILIDINVNLAAGLNVQQSQDKANISNHTANSTTNQVGLGASVAV